VIEKYDPKRFALILGRVQGTDAQAIEGVSIVIWRHPEYGSVQSDAEGKFSFPVKGGGDMTLEYRKKGLITSHRQVNVPWNDFVIADTISMIAQDPKSTSVVFDSNPDTVMTHQSSPVSDESGERSCSMVFTGDNTAYLVDENGNDIQPLTTINTRATEFHTPESMPAVLLPTFTYTYWWVAVTHFTPWDCNWPYGPPEGATYPNPESETDPDEPQEDDCETSMNS
jgi:hypothetical protein